MAVASPAVDFSLQLPEVTLCTACRASAIRWSSCSCGAYSGLSGLSPAVSASVLQNRLRPLAAASAEPDARLFHKPAVVSRKTRWRRSIPKMSQTALKPHTRFHTSCCQHDADGTRRGFSPYRAGKFIQRIHCDGDNVLIRIPFLIQFRVTLISRTYGQNCPYGVQQTRPAHREYPVFTTGIRLSTAVPAVLTGAERNRRDAGCCW